MEGERLGRVVSVALLALLVPLACAAFGVGTPAASGLPPSSASAPPAAQPDDGEEATTGPVTDEAFLATVRQTGRWAVPAGQQAQQRASNEELKDIGRALAEDLATLDDEAGAIAARLGLGLPDQASEEQRGWLTELAAKSGADYDLTFANRLRGGLGEVFLVAAHTRAGSWDDEVRAFASSVNDVVDRYMTDLENTGLVTDGAPQEPGRGGVAGGSTTETALGPATSIPEVTPVASTSTTDGGVHVGLVVLVCVAEAGLTAGVVIFLRSR
jgi:predicted outer membrane protein